MRGRTGAGPRLLRAAAAAEGAAGAGGLAAVQERLGGQGGYLG